MRYEEVINRRCMWIHNFKEAQRYFNMKTRIYCLPGKWPVENNGVPFPHMTVKDKKGKLKIAFLSLLRAFRRFQTNYSAIYSTGHFLAVHERKADDER